MRSPMRLVRAFAVVTLLALGAAAALAYHWYRQPLPLPSAPFDFEVRTGSTLSAVARQLHDSGVLVADDIPTDDPFISEERWKVNLDRLGAVQLPMTVQDAVAARLSALSTAERADEGAGRLAPQLVAVADEQSLPHLPRVGDALEQMHGDKSFPRTRCEC